MRYSEPKLWKSIVKGPFEQVNLSVDDYHSRHVDLNYVTDEADRRKIILDIKAYSSLTMGLPVEILMCVQEFVTAKSLWDALGVMFEGST
ncbi:hypothetical protein R6Q57_003496 [Mikania cordata]